MLARFSLSHRPPTGFLGGLGRRALRGAPRPLDLKEGGALPIVNLARWAGMATGVVCASTPSRLRAASEGGILSQADADTLVESFELVSELRLDHQSAQLMAGTEPDDFVDPSELSALTRTYLKEAFRAVAVGAAQHLQRPHLRCAVRLGGRGAGLLAGRCGLCPLRRAETAQHLGVRRATAWSTSS